MHVLRRAIKSCETITVVLQVQIRSTDYTKALFWVREYRAGNSAQTPKRSNGLYGMLLYMLRVHIVFLIETVGVILH